MSSRFVISLAKGAIVGHLLSALFFRLHDDREHAIMFLTGAVCWVIVWAIWSKVKDE